jgi:hypothetical protein
MSDQAINDLLGQMGMKEASPDTRNLQEEVKDFPNITTGDT